MRELALQLPTSVLYKISAPNFPEVLREYVLAEGNINISNKEVKEIHDKCKETGWENIENDMNEVHHKNYMLLQTGYALDLC